jgi:plasmid stabilization system protein ParE
VDFQVLYTDPALADLDEVFVWSVEHHPEDSESFGAALLDHIGQLSRFPYLGTGSSLRPIFGVLFILRFTCTTGS